MKAALFQQEFKPHVHLGAVPKMTVWRVGDWNPYMGYDNRYLSRGGVVLIKDRFYSVVQVKEINGKTFGWTIHTMLPSHIGQESPRKLSFAKKGK